MLYMSAPPLPRGGRLAAALAISKTRDSDARREIRDANKRCEVRNERFKMGDEKLGVRDGGLEREDEGWQMGENEA